MKIKLSLDTHTTDVLDVMIPTEDGKLVQNKDQPEEDQIRIENTVPSMSQKAYYVQERTIDKVTTRKYREDVCIERHCTKIIGLETAAEGHPITDGKSLLSAPASEDIQRIRTAVFLHIIVGDDKEEKKESV